jgi:hypothetical protein
MPSDFTYEGEQNNQYVFRERASGQVFSLAAQAGATPELLDGDEIALPRPGYTNEVDIYSLRQQRQVRSEYR